MVVVCVASFEAHDQQYRHNKQFQGEIRDWVKYGDWVVTAFFYCGVHMLEAVLAKKYNIHSKTHTSRHTSMYEHSEMFGNCVRTYRKLESLAHQSRYIDECVWCDDCVTQAQGYLDEIESWYREAV